MNKLTAIALITVIIIIGLAILLQFSPDLKFITNSISDFLLDLILPDIETLFQ